MTGEQTNHEAWQEVGRQFQAFGENLAAAFRAAWEDEENRRHLRDVRAGLEAVADEIGQAVRRASESPGGQKVRQEAEKAVESARAAGKQAVEDARPYLLSALRQVNAELEKVIDRLERCESPADE